MLNRAFKKASKSTNIKFRPNTPDYIKARKRETSRIQVVSDYLISQLEQIEKSFPSIENLHPFYNELLDILVDKDLIKSNLGSVGGIKNILKKINREIKEKIRRSKVPDDIGKYRLHYYGRISSIIKKINNQLLYLDECRYKFKSIPTFNIDGPILVIAGYPNVGKSSLIRIISTAKPKIDYYPFTTKNLFVGHMVVKGTKIQIIDTPGLLDRSLNERNKIELQAIIALKYLANKIIYLFDASGNSGYSLDDQIKLFNELTEIFPDTPIIPCLNKTDLKTFDQIPKEFASRIQFKISTITKDGIDDLISYVFQDMV